MEAKNKQKMLRQALEEEMQIASTFMRTCPAPPLANNKTKYKVLLLSLQSYRRVKDILTGAGVLVVV